jgi:flagellar basal body-associated protein FliL
MCREREDLGIVLFGEYFRDSTVMGRKRECLCWVIVIVLLVVAAVVLIVLWQVVWKDKGGGGEGGSPSATPIASESFS